MLLDNLRTNRERVIFSSSESKIKKKKVLSSLTNQHSVILPSILLCAIIKQTNQDSSNIERTHSSVHQITHTCTFHENRPFATAITWYQNPPCWRASSLLFPHWDKEKLDLPLFWCPSAGIITSLPSSMADFGTTWSLAAKGLLNDPKQCVLFLFTLSLLLFITSVRRYNL